MATSEPQWLTWGRELAALAQSGLAFEPGPYDRERYERLRELAARMLAHHTDEPAERIADLFARETGYATPKIDVRAAVFDAHHRLLMVRETADEGRWTLPGGWADVNLTPAENAVKEAREESGYEVEVTKVAAVWDRTRQAHAHGPFSCCKLFFVGRVLGGKATPSSETSEVAWFGESELPDGLSLGRVLPRQLHRMFEHHRDPALPTDFD